jgi:CheY-like chemotaxis protein
MPEMTGDDMVVEIKADRRLRHIPVIMATAAASPTRVKRMQDLGVLEVVAKPMDEDTMLDAVRRALEPGD